MTVLEYTIEIDRPPDEVFGVVADPRNDHRWCPRVGECRQLRGDGPRLGARYELRHHPTLKRPHSRWIEIVGVDPPTSVVSVQEDEVARFTISYALEPTATGTRLTQRDEIEWRIGVLSRPIARWIINRHISGQLRSLKRLLETSD